MRTRFTLAAALAAAAIASGCAGAPPATAASPVPTAAAAAPSPSAAPTPSSGTEAPPSDPFSRKADLAGIIDVYERAAKTAFTLIGQGDFPLIQYELALADYNLDGAPELVVWTEGNFEGSHTVFDLSGDTSRLAGGYSVANGKNAFYLARDAAGGARLCLEAEGGHGATQYSISVVTSLVGGALDTWERRVSAETGQDGPEAAACDIYHNGERLFSGGELDAGASAYDDSFLLKRLEAEAPAVLEREVAGNTSALWEQVSLQALRERIAALRPVFEARSAAAQSP